MKIEIELHLQCRDPAPQSLDVLLVNKRGEWAVGYNAEDKGFFLTDSSALQEFHDVVYWASFPKIPVNFTCGGFASDEAFNACMKSGLLGK